MEIMDQRVQFLLEAAVVEQEYQDVTKELLDQAVEEEEVLQVLLLAQAEQTLAVVAVVVMVVVIQVKQAVQVELS